MKRFFAVLLACIILLAGWLWLRKSSHSSPGATTPASPDIARAAQTGTAATPSSSAASVSTVPIKMPLVLMADAPLEFDRFNKWFARYLVATPAERPALLPEGRELATIRRASLARLITQDPRRALSLAMPMVARQQLPADIVALLEERVSSRASLGVLGVVGASTETPAIRRIVRLNDGPRYEAYVVGRRSTQRTTESIHATGIAVDRALALDERPLRVLEAGEIPDASKPRIETCLVSGNATAPGQPGGTLPPITENTPAVEIDGTIHYLCSGGHIEIVEERLVAGEGASGGALKPTTAIASTQSTGVRSLLYMRVTFPDSNRDPQSETAAYEMMRQVNDWFVENSYGNLYLVTTVAPLIVLPRTEAWYTGGGGDEYDLRSDAQEVARQLGYDTTQYDLDIVTYTGGPGGFGGLGYVGGKGSWIKSITVGVICHELGHNFGLWHANFWNTSGISTIGAGANTEYGNNFDTMGSAGAGDLHFNANHKTILNWLPAQSYVQTVTTSGTYRLFAFDQNRLDPANRYALKVAKDSARSYWAEFRQRSLGNNRWTKDGILLNWGSWLSSNGGAHLLDTTPGSPDDRTDAAVTIGRTFSDFEAGVHLTPIGKGGTSPESMDVVVNLGPFPGNQPPTLAISASASTAAVNASVSFTATATDPDGDALSYAWDFGDKTFATINSTAVTKSWSATGDYVVRCVASDMKGQTTSRVTTVRVGSATTFRVSGQITLGGQPLADVRVHNGLTGASYRGTYSNSDGSYTISGLNSGSYTLGASLYGYTFTVSGFTNPLAVSADVAGANFTTVTPTTVAIAMTDNDCTEGAANPGRFALTRTGSTAAALTVNLLNPTGTALRVSDYALAPDLLFASPFYAATIPAGAATLDIVVTAVDDIAAEGPEIAIFELAPSGNYTITGAARADLVIQDNDTTKPVVSLKLIDPTATEGSDGASFLVSRTGPTVGALPVFFTLAGSALSGTDYVSPGTQVTIPDGASTVLLNITPLNDSLVEGNEIVTVTLGTHTDYIRTPTFADYNGTANLLDDDIATVTVIASDAAAAEAGADPGVFLITRTGNTSQPLTVNYALSGSAAQGIDYLPVAGVLTLPAGASSGAVTIVPIDDNLGEPAQTVVLQLRGGPTYVSGDPALATITITDNNDPPVVTVGLSDGTMIEPGDTGKFRFTTTGTGIGNITVRYTLSGTATIGVDYVAVSGALVMGRNTTAELTITPLDDALLEGYETIRLTIDADPSYTTHLDAQVTLNLIDNDQAVVNVTADNTPFSENGGAGRFYISRTGSTASILSVNYTLGGTALNGTDYMLLSGTADIPAGSAGVVVVMTPVNDVLIEGTETAVLTITPGGYGLGLSTSTLYLYDNEVPTTQVRFTNSTGTGLETVGLVAVPVSLTLPAPAGGITVEYVLTGGSALSGIDYQFTPGVLTFAAGETVKTIPLTILDDFYIEPSQTVIVKLQNANGAAISMSTFTYTITDDDPSTPSFPVVTVATTSPTAAEFGNTPGTFTVTRTGNTSLALTVNFALTGTATSGADYASPGTSCVIPVGQSTATVTILPQADALAEGNETVQLALTAAAIYTLGSPAVATVTLTDLPIDNWRAKKFGQQANLPAIAGDLADPDTDGLVNIVEYATGGDPFSFTPAPLSSMNAGSLTLAYYRALAAVDVVYAIEEVSVLNGTWAIVATTDQILSDNGTIRVIQAIAPASVGPSKFLRLRVTR